ncbi:putative transcription factor C3H family [Helianthus anomalus]
MCQLVLGCGSDSLPQRQRPDEADCIFYLRTGFCGYGSRCRFNHPVDRGGSVFGGVRSGGGEYPEHIGEPVCETFIKYNQQSKAIKRELIQFGAPIFGQVKDDAITKSQDGKHPQ